jgi:putative FmdB family regulatory protein
MPKYDYRCRACGQTFEIIAGMNDSRDDVVCQGCSSADVFRLYGGIGTTGMSSGPSAASAAVSAAHSHGGGCCGGH